MDGLESAGAGTLLRLVHDGVGGDDGAVGDDDDGELVLVLEVVNDASGDLTEGSERAERNADEQVFLEVALSGLVFNFFSRVDVDELEVGSDVSVLLNILEVLEGLRDLFFELGGLGTVSLDNLLCVEHLLNA